MKTWTRFVRRRACHLPVWVGMLSRHYDDEPPNWGEWWERVKERDRARREQQERIDTARPKLAALTDRTARAVLALHDEDHNHCCTGCDMDGFEAERPPWPCTTVRVVALVHEIDIPERP